MVTVKLTSKMLGATNCQMPHMVNEGQTYIAIITPGNVKIGEIK